MYEYKEEFQRRRHLLKINLNLNTEVKGSKGIRNPSSLDRQFYYTIITPDDTAATLEVKAIGSDKHMQWIVRSKRLYTKNLTTFTFFYFIY